MGTEVLTRRGWQRGQSRSMLSATGGLATITRTTHTVDPATGHTTDVTTTVYTDLPCRIRANFTQPTYPAATGAGTAVAPFQALFPFDANVTTYPLLHRGDRIAMSGHTYVVLWPFEVQPGDAVVRADVQGIG